MPVDVYVNTNQSAGEEASSTGEGRHLTFEESVLSHPYHSDGFVDGGDPVQFGNGGVGVALKSAAAATDMIAVDTEGIWWLNVLGAKSDWTGDGVAATLAEGDPIYIQKTPSTDVYLLSGQDNPQNYRLFGYLVTTSVTASLTVPTLVAVKVHWAPNSLERLHIGEFNDNLLIDVVAEAAAGQNNPGWMRAFIGASTLIGATQQLYGDSIRVANEIDASSGTLTAREAKAVNYGSTQLVGLFGMKFNIDNRTGAGGAAIAAGIEILAEGAGTAHDVLTGIRFHQKDTDGTLMSAMRFDTTTTFGIAAVTSNPSDTGVCYQIPIDIAGVLYYLLAYNAAGS